MKIMHFGITFWFNIYDEYSSLLENLKEKLQDEYNSFNYNNIDEHNLLSPIITAINNDKKTNMHVTRISAQYNMDSVDVDNFDEFQEKAMNLFNILNDEHVNVLYCSVVINAEKECEDPLNVINKNIIKEELITTDLTETDIKLANIIDEQFYKIIRLTNNKQIKIARRVDEKNREIPVPLISLNGSFVERECIVIDYEINDRYLYDFTKDYCTTTFYLNKMLYLAKENFASDVNSLTN